MPSTDAAIVSEARSLVHAARAAVRALAGRPEKKILYSMCKASSITTLHSLALHNATI